MKRYNHHGTVVSEEHPRGNWCMWDDVAPLLRLAEDMACVLEDVEDVMRHQHGELCKDVSRQLKAWKEWYR